MGEIISLYKDCYHYELPKMPTREEEFLNYEYKKKDQFWRTPEFPVAFDWKRMSKREQYDIVERERERWVNGVWFFNDGEPTYITGMHYDHLAYATFEFGKAQYYDSQRKDFYFRDYTRKDPDSFGRNWLKPRRYGMTLQEITEQTYTAIEDENRLQGMISDNRDKTYDTIFTPLVTSYLKRPIWSRPKIYTPNGRIPKQKLVFNDGMIADNFDEGMSLGAAGCLNSLIQPKPTTVIGYDGWKLHYLTLDEVWKWVGADPAKCYDKQKKCFLVGSKIIGKCSVLSTMGDDDSYEKAIAAGIQMWYDSDPRIRTNNRTTSGLYRYFVSGIYSQFDFADKYGIINEDQATQYIMDERSKFSPGSKEYLYECRKVPLTEEDAISTANTSAIFDYKRVQSSIEILKKTPEKSRPTAFYDLHEHPQTKRIEAEPKKWGDGDWELAVLPKIDKNNDFSNRWFEDQSGNVHLMPNPQGCIGYDPIRYAEGDTKSNNLSMAAAIARQKFDYYNNGGKNLYTGLYHQRPPDAEDAHYEVYKYSKFMGFPIMYERQVESFKRRMIELFFKSALLKSRYDGGFGIWTRANVVKDGVDLLTAYTKPPKTVEEMHNFDYMGKIPFVSFLEQMQTFNPAKTTIFDIMMADMMLESGLLQILEVNYSEDFVNRENKLIKAFIPTR